MEEERKFISTLGNLTHLLSTQLPNSHNPFSELAHLNPMADPRLLFEWGRTGGHNITLFIILFRWGMGGLLMMGRGPCGI